MLRPHAIRAWHTLDCRTARHVANGGCHLEIPRQRWRPHAPRRSSIHRPTVGAPSSPGSLTSGSLHRADALDKPAALTSIFWRTTLTNNWARAAGYDFAWPLIEAAQAAAEAVGASAAEAAEREAASAKDAAAAAAVLAAADNSVAARCAEAAHELIVTLMTALHDGYHVPAPVSALTLDVQKIFYPEWWLKMVGYYKPPLYLLPQPTDRSPATDNHRIISTLNPVFKVFGAAAALDSPASASRAGESEPQPRQVLLAGVDTPALDSKEASWSTSSLVVFGAILFSGGLVIGAAAGRRGGASAYQCCGPRGGAEQGGGYFVSPYYSFEPPARPLDASNAA